MSGFDLTPIAITIAGRYKLTEQIGSGDSSMYLASDVRTSTTVAIQVRPVGTADAATVLGFREATETVRSYDHPALVRVLDAGLDVVEGDRVFFTVMEHLSGGSLRDMIDRGRRLTPSQALVIGLDACRALSYAHSNGAIHGDLRPASLQFGPDRRARLAGVGLATPTSSANMSLDRARYAAPELAKDEPAGPKADVYSLAILLVEAITGEVPFAAESAAVTMANKTDRLLPVSADLGALAAVLERAARPDVEDRYTSREFGEALVQVAPLLPKPTPIDVAGEALTPEALEVAGPEEPIAPVVSISDLKPIVIGGTGEIERLISERAAVSSQSPDNSGPLIIGGLDATAVDDSRVVVQPVPQKKRLLFKSIVAVLSVVAVIAGGLFTWNTWLIPAHAVPLVKGATQSEALNILATSKWHVEIKSERNDEITEGSVIRTEPEAGTSLKENRTLVLVISLGPKFRKLTDLRGETLEVAKAQLADQGLVFVDGGNIYSEKVPIGSVVRWKVVDQPNLETGAEVAKGTKIAVTISKGPKPRTVPNLAGLTLEEAKAKLEKLKLEYVEGPGGVSNIVVVGGVIAQIPAPGTVVERGSKVLVSISTGQDVVEMPDIFGVTFGYVEYRLNSRGLKVGTISGSKNAPLLRAAIGGKVVHAGDKVLRGSIVDLYFS